jgi:phytoene dehydrogenase-like protein
MEHSGIRAERFVINVLSYLMQKEAKKIVIIGAGPAGLTAGIYARQAGFEVVVLEKHNLPGGLCTAWKRDG